MKSSAKSLRASKGILEGGNDVDIWLGGFHFNLDGNLGKDMPFSAFYV